MKKKFGKNFFEDFFMHRIQIGPISLMIKKELIQNINLLFNENSRYSEEFIFICKLLYNTNKAIHVKEKLYNYCLRNGSVSTGANLEKIINGYNEILKSNVLYKDKEEKSCKLYNKYAMPRWILATARFTASNLKYEQYKELMNKLNAKKEVKRLFSFPDVKTKIAAIIFCISLSTFYNISK